ncbi:MAG: AMP-binding protein, partial [Terriglobia bacterium]
MSDTALLPDLIAASASRFSHQPALTFGGDVLSYGALANEVAAFASGLVSLGLAKSERVGVFLDKRPETVVAAFGTSAAGGVFVPVNPLLKAEQVT